MSRKSRGFVLAELLVAIVIGSVFMGLIAILLGNMTTALVKLKEKVEFFDRASQAFLLLKRDIFQGTHGFSGKNPANLKVDIGISADQSKFYPVNNALQFLAKPPDFFPIFKSGSGQYLNGLSVWSVHFLFPLKIISGQKGQNFLSYSPGQSFSYASQAFDPGDIIGVLENSSLQILEISRVSSAGIFVTKPLFFSVKEAQCGLLVSALWYIGKSPEGSRALYRYQNGISEKMVSQIDAFGIEPESPHKIWVQQGKTRYAF